MGEFKEDSCALYEESRKISQKSLRLDPTSTVDPAENGQITHVHGTGIKAKIGGAVDTIVTLAQTQVLTNKRLNSPKINEDVAVAATATEINKLASVVAGTAAASKAAVLGADKNLDVIAVADLKLGAGAGTSIVPTAAKINLLAQGVAAGYKIGRGLTAVTGTADIATGLATTVQVTANLKPDAALAGALVTVADSATAGNIILKVWKFTGAADCTPIAATVAADVRWVAIGT